MPSRDVIVILFTLVLDFFFSIVGHFMRIVIPAYEYLVYVQFIHKGIYHEKKKKVSDVRPARVIRASIKNYVHTFQRGTST